MKKIAFILILSTLFVHSANAGFAAEVFDESQSQETPVVVEQAEQTAPPTINEDPAKKKKFFSILEKGSEKSGEKKAQDADAENQPVTNVLVDSDQIEYFPERHEFEAIGNARVTFPEENSVLTADKILFNHDTNYIKAYDNVVILRENERILGDYVQINLNDDNALITAPVMSHMNIQIKAKNGNINKAKVEAMEGTAKFTDSATFNLKMRSVYNFDNPMVEDSFEKKYFLKEKYNNEWNLKSKIIIIDSYKDRDIVTLQNSDVFLKDLKIGSTGKLKIYTDKDQQYVETSMAQFGSIRNIGAFVAPSYVFELPFSSTFKVGPMLNYDDSNIGFGGLGRFQSGSNSTDIGYSTARGSVVLRGKHQFNDHVSAQYGINAYMNEWWMGGRMPKYGAQLMYQSDPIENEDLRLTFQQRFSGGFYKDWGEDRNFSTARMRWQTQTMKGLYSYKNTDKTFAADIGLAIQSTATLYGTGDTYGLIRTGPYLRTQYKNWQQYAAYYMGAAAGDSPFWFDKYFYGKSSVMLGESYRVNKYLTLMYSAIIALSDTPNDKFLQENRFYVVVGPDDFKVLLGYDAFRQNTTFGINMTVGTENSEVEFKKLILNEPEYMGKGGKKRNTKNVADKKEQKIEDPMNRSVKEYPEYNPGYGALNNLIQPGIRPAGY